MINFKELSNSGDDFELLVRELLYSKGLEVYWSGKGCDGGKDLLCIETYKSHFKTSNKRWLVQCKHNANAKKTKSVSIGDLGNIVDACYQHNTTGFLLVCSTYPSSSLVKRLEEIENNKLLNITTCFWDCKSLERELLTPRNLHIANTFFPKSFKKIGWRISNIEPNFWHAHYKGHIFYIATRIGNDYDILLTRIENIITGIDKVTIKENHIIRLRAIYFDGKHENFHVYLDYLYPKSKNKEDNNLYYKQKEKIVNGSWHMYDIIPYTYNEYSDHFHMDHYDYYKNFLGTFRSGYSREESRKFFHADKDSMLELTEEVINTDFYLLIDSLKKLDFIEIFNPSNSKIEFVDQFSENFSWSYLKYGNLDSCFDVQVRFICNNFKFLVNLLNLFPQNSKKQFKLERNYTFLLDGGLDSDKDIYTLRFLIWSEFVSSKSQYRKKLNLYLKEITEIINKYTSETQL